LESDFSDLKSIRMKNFNKLIIAHLNINSIRNKFDYLVDKIKRYVDILMIPETKLDSTFPVGQFVINGFSTPFRLDRNRNGGGIMLYVREDIPVKLLFTEVLPIESF
jgi:exonuclease III